MTMNLNTLFKKQMELDAHITQKRGLEGQLLLDKRIVALICELYECVNEARFFKFWSDDQKPNNICKECGGSGVRYVAPTIPNPCDSCAGYPERYNPLLEEYADVIHFALSVANSLGVHEHEYIETQPEDLNKLVIGITNQATVLSLSRSKEHVSSLLNNIIAFGYQLGFDEQQVIDAYNAKHQENYRRQKVGY